MVGGSQGPTKDESLDKIRPKTLLPSIVNSEDRQLSTRASRTLSRKPETNARLASFHFPSSAPGSSPDGTTERLGTRIITEKADVPTSCCKVIDSGGCVPSPMLPHTLLDAEGFQLLAPICCWVNFERPKMSSTKWKPVPQTLRGWNPGTLEP